jgi:hypothetical protein
MCYSPANSKRFSVVMHVAHIAGLVPGAMYWYQPGGGGGDSSQRTLRFRAPLRTGSLRSFSLLAFGDMGQSLYKSRKTQM